MLYCLKSQHSIYFAHLAIQSYRTTFCPSHVVKEHLILMLQACQLFDIIETLHLPQYIEISVKDNANNDASNNETNYENDKNNNDENNENNNETCQENQSVTPESTLETLHSLIPIEIFNTIDWDSIVKSTSKTTSNDQSSFTFKNLEGPSPHMMALDGSNTLLNNQFKLVPSPCPTWILQPINGTGLDSNLIQEKSPEIPIKVEPKMFNLSVNTNKIGSQLEKKSTLHLSNSPTDFQSLFPELENITFETESFFL